MHHRFWVQILQYKGTMKDFRSSLLVILAVLCLVGAVACERKPRTYAGVEPSAAKGTPVASGTIDPQAQY